LVYLALKCDLGGINPSDLTVKLGLTIENNANYDKINLIVDSVDLTVDSYGQITARASVGLQAHIYAAIGGDVVTVSVQNRELNIVDATPAGVATMLRINLGRIVSSISANDSTINTSGWPLVDPTVTGDFSVTAVIKVEKSGGGVIQVIDDHHDPLEPEATVTVTSGAVAVTGNAIAGTVTLIP